MYRNSVVYLKLDKNNLAVDFRIKEDKAEQSDEEGNDEEGNDEEENDEEENEEASEEESFNCSNGVFKFSCINSMFVIGRPFAKMPGFFIKCLSNNLAHF